MIHATTQVRVANLATALDLAKGWADRVVSFADPKTELPNFHTWHHIIRCNDTEVLSDPWAPQRHDIEQALDFCVPLSNILVHCEGGISRSTAFAIGLFARADFSIPDITIPEAVNLVFQQAPRMAPNRLILRHLESILQLDGLFVQQVASAFDRLPKGLWLWCNDCKTHFVDGQNCPGKHFTPTLDEEVYG